MRRSLSKVNCSGILWDLARYQKKIFWTKNRKLKISPNLVGKTIILYNGIKYYPIVIEDEIVGKALGIFSVSRKNNTKKILKKGKR